VSNIKDIVSLFLKPFEQHLLQSSPIIWQQLNSGRDSIKVGKLEIEKKSVNLHNESDYL
jgi:hypothetical protein